MNEASTEQSALERVRARRRTRKRRKLAKRLAPVAVIVVASAVAYGLGIWYFSEHYYPGTTVAGIDASMMQESELAKAVDAQASDYAIHAELGDFVIDATAEQLGVPHNGAELARQARERMQVTSWPMEAFGEQHNADEALSFDDAKLTSVVSEATEAYNQTASLPQDAQLDFDEEAGRFIAIDDVDGTALDSTRVSEAMSDAIHAAQRQVELDESVRVQPDIPADSPQTLAKLDQLNAALDLPIPLTYEGKQLHVLERADAIQWVAANDDWTIHVRKSALAMWTEGLELWSTVDHHDDADVYVLDTTALMPLLETALNEGSSEAIEVPVLQMSRYLPDLGGAPDAAWDESEGRYAEVDISNQVARFFASDGTVLWQSIVTTGKVVDGSSTPVGTFAIYDKHTDFMLLGADQDGDGEYDYHFHVDYWMPFNEGVGFHDAYWRKEFGGDTYIENGSGGCVNLTKEGAKALYAMIHVGDKVIVHE